MNTCRLVFCLLAVFAGAPAFAAPTAARHFIAASRLPLWACRSNGGTLVNGSLEANKFGDMIELHYGAALADEKSVGREPISDAEMAGMIRYMACISSWNGTDGVASTFAALFASRRHGKAAFVALAALAKNKAATPDDRRAATEFSQQLHNYVEGPRE
jgi:uncharacterized protein YjeT (DUF2065 family)